MSDNPYVAPSHFKDRALPERLTLDLKSLIFVSAIVGVVFAVLAAVITIVIFAFGWGEWQMVVVSSPMAGVIAFLASLILSVLDVVRGRRAYHRVQRRLIIRGDMSVDEFVAELPEHDQRILSAIRESVATYFQVPESKIYPSDEFNSDYPEINIDAMFALFVLMSSMESLKMSPVSDEFSFYGASSIVDIAKVIEDYEQGIDVREG